MYACIYAPGLTGEKISLLRACAEAFSPNVEFRSEMAILDIRGLRTLYGCPESIGKAIAERVAALGARVGVAANPHSAIAAARGFTGLTVIPPGEECRVLSTLPLELLSPDEEMQQTLADWGIRNFAELAALPEDGIAERLGSAGVRLHKMARGIGERPLVPLKEDPVFQAGMQLDHSLELLEPLLFILSLLLNEICASLASHSLAANELELRLELDNKGEYTRNIRLPFATREASTFLKLLQYDLAAHPPNSPIVGVYLTAAPVHPRVVQGGLFIPLAPEPEKLELTLARITVIVGEGNVGTPELLDTHRPGAFRMTRFHAKQADVPRSIECSEPRLAIRIYRPPLPANVVTQRGRPARIAARGVSGVVTAYAGPWRTSGDWIAQDAWEHDEWDVALQSGGVYRLRRLAMNQWLIDGNYD
jgi:protein ImuB